MIMADAPTVNAPFPRTSPTKRSFDVAFLTGARDSSESPQRSPVNPPSPISSTPLHFSPSSLSNSSLQQSSSPEVSSSRITAMTSLTPPSTKQSRVSDSSPSDLSCARNSTPSTEEEPPTSAFTKVSRSQEAVTSRISSDNLPPLTSPSNWSTSSASLNAVSSFLSGNKNLAPLLATSGIFNPSLSPLFPPDRVNNNFVEEYLKSQQNIMAGKSSTEIPMSPTEALSRLRSSMYPNDPYKMPFASLSYPLTSQSSQTTPKLNSVPFMPQNPVSAMIPNALNTLSLASQNVCAKCNISFRMTSDLVYHMRSQHKREQDPYKKRRNDRLKCSICGESFRERHHLTRHMTAHQDRTDEDDVK